MNDDTTNPPLPEKLLSRLQRIWPPEHMNELLGRFNDAFSTVFRINTLRTTPQACINQCLAQGLTPEPIDDLPNTFQIPLSQRLSLTHSALFTGGQLYIQNPSSILAALLLDAQPDEEILDLTAAPGGKTIVLAQSMHNTGRIAAVEFSKSRFYKLKNNLERCGVTNTQLYLKDGRKVGHQVPERFDKVLLDAPCSAEAEIHLADPKSYANWSEKKVKRLHGKQFQLLESAYRALKPGGTLLYCTCTFGPEENEAVVNALIERYPGTTLMPIATPSFLSQGGLTHWEDKSYHPSLQLATRILPDARNKGFFIAKMIK